ncbi:hypothetical protein F0Q45_12825 [Mycobacterium simiae]|uniref:Uncharacterized protein n=1 Tax=Mycobacterium simiae TaxID=1784 RepID=A0A5B1BP11_MYCSI|nr:hypothetical protein [Mycobacterium simiae]KAA1249841.1 hypothetical protein F0Q45_12825 [Mycobacterium simiae]
MAIERAGQYMADESFSLHPIRYIYASELLHSDIPADTVRSHSDKADTVFRDLALAQPTLAPARRNRSGL